MSRKAGRARSVQKDIGIVLSTAELYTLDELAHYYHKSMGPMRYIVRFTAAAEVRAKYRFIAQESLWLDRFIKAVLEEPVADGEERCVEFAPPALVAYWGRVLSSLHSKRARRRMKPHDLATRERLSQKFLEAARTLERHQPGSLEIELRTRRPTEVVWMQEQLGAEAEKPAESGT